MILGIFQLMDYNMTINILKKTEKYTIQSVI